MNNSQQNWNTARRSPGRPKGSKNKNSGGYTKGTPLLTFLMDCAYVTLGYIGSDLIAKAIASFIHKDSKSYGDRKTDPQALIYKDKMSYISKTAFIEGLLSLGMYATGKWLVKRNDRFFHMVSVGSTVKTINTILNLVPTGSGFSWTFGGSGAERYIEEEVKHRKRSSTTGDLGCNDSIPLAFDPQRQAYVHK